MFQVGDIVTEKSFDSGWEYEVTNIPNIPSTLIRLRIRKIGSSTSSLLVGMDIGHHFAIGFRLVEKAKKIFRSHPLTSIFKNV